MSETSLNPQQILRLGVFLTLLEYDIQNNKPSINLDAITLCQVWPTQIRTLRGLLNGNFPVTGEVQRLLEDVPAPMDEVLDYPLSAIVDVLNYTET